MKILAFSDINLLESPVEKLQSIVTTEQIDVVILLGGLFPKIETLAKEKGKKLNKKNNASPEKAKELEKLDIMQLNWLLIPILVIPDQNDLKMTYLIKQIQGQEAVWIRYIHNKGTIIDSWFIFSITESEEEEQESMMKTIEEYSKIAPDRSILLYIGKKRISFPNISSVFLNQDTKKTESNSFVVTVDSIKDNTVTIIDLDAKTVNSMLVQ